MEDDARASLRLTAPAPGLASPVAPAVTEPSPTPLAFDLDGTVVRSDLLVEALLALAGADPLGVLSAAAALPHGKAAFKAAVADRALPDPATLPYDPAVLEMAAAARREGRSTLLVSAADARYVRAVADHLGVFDGALGSDGATNLSGERKAQALVDRYGEGGFDYVGDAAVDAAVWRRARRGFVRAPSPSLRSRLRAQGLEVAPVGERVPQGPALLRAMRPHQWMKNALIFAPALGAHALGAPLLACVAAFVSFSLCASSVYVLNDLLDLKSDRRHPRKRLRPFASGEVAPSRGALLAPLLLAGAVATALLLPPHFLTVLAGYYALTLAYSLGLKRVVMIDVVTLGCLYGARLMAGSAATDIALSNWLGVLALFLFMSLALVKRAAELVDRTAHCQGDLPGRGYRLTDLPMVEALAGAAGFTAVLVLALYLNSPDVARLYHAPRRLWLICVVLLYWISRILIITHRGEMDDDPVVFAVRDRVSLACGAVCVAVLAVSL